MENVELFLSQGDGWHSGAEPHIRAARSDMTRVPIDGEEKLLASDATDPLVGGITPCVCVAGARGRPEATTRSRRSSAVVGRWSQPRYRRARC